MDPIWDYLIEGLLPNDSKEASKLRTRSARFTIYRGSLYKRGFFTPILKCIAGKDADVSNSALGLLYEHGILTIYENLLL